MRPKMSLDALVKARLRTWPQRPPGLGAVGSGHDTWLRGRPADEFNHNPFLKLPGSDSFRTLPDGLWLNFGGTPVEPFVDILAAEACGSLASRVPFPLRSTKETTVSAPERERTT